MQCAMCRMLGGCDDCSTGQTSKTLRLLHSNDQEMGMWPDKNVHGLGCALSLLTCLSQTNKLAVVVVMPKAYQYHSYWFANHTVILPASSPTPI